MEAILGLLKDLWGVWTEMFVVIRDFVFQILMFILWAICGLIILPCVYVSGNLFPKWSEWGEKM